MSEKLRAKIEGKCAEFRLLFARIPMFAGGEALPTAEASEIVSRLVRLCAELWDESVPLREMDEFVLWYGKMLLCPTSAVRSSPVLGTEREEIIARANEWLPRSMNARSVGNSSKPGTHEKPLRDAEIAAEVALLRLNGRTRKQAEAEVETRYPGASAKHATDRTRARRKQKSPD